MAAKNHYYLITLDPSWSTLTFLPMRDRNAERTRERLAVARLRSRTARRRADAIRIGSPECVGTSSG